MKLSQEKEEICEFILKLNRGNSKYAFVEDKLGKFMIKLASIQWF